MRKVVWICLTTVLATSALFAAAPPDRMHYQGVLRDAGGDPLDGTYDMAFAFFSDETLGDEILLDQHVAANAQAVTVTGGLFSVALGGGEMLDGSGPGTYASLADLFAAHGEVWLEIRVGAETLSPRMRVKSSAYALNAGRLDGRSASEFVDTSATEQGKAGKLVVGQPTGTGFSYGIEGYGLEGGGYFQDTDNLGEAYAGWGGFGVIGIGSSVGGYFEDQDEPTTQATVGGLGFGINASGSTAGGQFEDTDGSGNAWIAWGDVGVWAEGNDYGAHLIDADQTGSAYIAYGNQGIQASGASAGGYFFDTNSSGYAYAGYGNYGIHGYGTTAGGYFKDDDSSGYAYLGYGNSGVQGFGSSYGAYFADLDDTSYAYVGDENNGISAYGYSAGGYFEDLDQTGYAIAGYGDWGLYALGNSGGVTAVDGNSGIVGYLATGSSSTQGNGAKNFVQNHPYDDDRVILYAAPEGNEVATYTRGTARLADGEARIALDETFAWVTNPDIGLTAHLTSRTGGAVLHVVELSTSELVVRGTTADAVFDYMVWGLRIGFEEVGIVQEKGAFEAYIPSMEAQHVRHETYPDLYKYTALERFTTMNVALGKGSYVDTSASTALRDAIGVFDPAVHEIGVRPRRLRATEGVATEQVATAEAPQAANVIDQSAAPTPAPVAIPDRPAEGGRGDAARLPVAEAVAAGELIVIDESGELRRGLGEADPGVVGIAAEDSVPIDGTPHVTLVTTGITMLKVDADLGAVARGDALVSSPTPGHAMRSYASIRGTVIAKALEPLASGRGAIRVLVAPR